VRIGDFYPGRIAIESIENAAARAAAAARRRIGRGGLTAVLGSRGHASDTVSRA
jgi:hypothetical protein